MDGDGTIDLFIAGAIEVSGGTRNAVLLNRGGNSQTVTPGQVINLLIYWNNNVANGANILIKFFTAAGEGFAFNLDPQGNGLP